MALSNADASEAEDLEGGLVIDAFGDPTVDTRSRSCTCIIEQKCR